MNYLFLFFLLFKFEYVYSQVYTCPNYELINRRHDRSNKNKKDIIECNFVVLNPKKVINRYKNDLANHVPLKPFGSICIKCSMCLAVAKELDKVFTELSTLHRTTKQSIAVNLLKENIELLCANGFENHDLRKFKEFQAVTDELSCSTHVRTKMDGKWTEKLREMCVTYSRYMDVQHLFNEYLTEKYNITAYLCRNKGMFRDCSSLDTKDANLSQDDISCGKIF